MAKEQFEAIFNSNPQKTELQKALKRIEDHIEAIREASLDPRVSQRVKDSISELKYQRGKIIEKTKELG